MMSEGNQQLEGNPRGIPKAPFIEDVATFIKPDQAESTLEKFNEMMYLCTPLIIHLAESSSTWRVI